MLIEHSMTSYKEKHSVPQNMQRWALAAQLLLNGCADTCAASILAILSAIAQAQFK